METQRTVQAHAMHALWWTVGSCRQHSPDKRLAAAAPTHRSRAGGCRRHWGCSCSKSCTGGGTGCAAQRKHWAEQQSLGGGRLRGCRRAHRLEWQAGMGVSLMQHASSPLLSNGHQVVWIQLCSGEPTAAPHLASIPASTYAPSSTQHIEQVCGEPMVLAAGTASAGAANACGVGTGWERGAQACHSRFRCALISSIQLCSW